MKSGHIPECSQAHTSRVVWHHSDSHGFDGAPDELAQAQATPPAGGHPTKALGLRASTAQRLPQTKASDRTFQLSAGARQLL